MDGKELEAKDFDFHIYPFLELEDVDITVPVTNSADTFGLELGTDELYH